jgi:hypothetical protein
MAYSAANGNTVEAYTSGLPPAQSLSAVSTTGAGTVLDGLVARATQMMVVTHFGRRLSGLSGPPGQFR